MIIKRYLSGLSLTKKILLGSVPLLAVGILGLGNGWFGARYHSGTIVERSRPHAVTQARAQAQSQAVKDHSGETMAKQILFGDLHVHTTYSPDAFTISLPIQSGEGAHPPSDACNYARYCSALDFWSINDHAEGLSPWQWAETKEAIRQCNAAAGDGQNPDMVSFLGWEWTQVGTNPDNHYGHKNVVLLETAEDKVPQRPIASTPPPGSPVEALQRGTNFWQRVGIGITAPLMPGDSSHYLSFTRFLADQVARTACDMTKGVHELPPNCTEAVATPADLFARLDQWKTPTLVIPHGTTWGFYTPPGSDWAKQLKGKMHEPSMQSLIELFSGHGNAEEYRQYREVVQNHKGQWVCPQPTKEYLPGCVQAGRIVFKRCQEAGRPKKECRQLEQKARQIFVDAGNPGHLTVTGTRGADWLDAAQCTNCYLPAFNHRVLGAVQYIMALTNFDEDQPRRFNFGFIGSSDNHFARPGTGFKEYQRIGITESTHMNTAALADFMASPIQEKLVEPVPVNLSERPIHPLFMVETERQSSYFTTGGLIAVHSQGRDRQAIWDAMQNKEVYATSGERILLWFDLLNSPQGKVPMGATVQMNAVPTFKVTALGAFKQKPGCPPDSIRALGGEEIDRLCHGECYNPSDRRQSIVRIEVIKITPQGYANEPVDKLIQDPFRIHRCATNNSGGCSFTFSDTSFKRDSLYYARVIQAKQPVINGGQIRCKRDEQGQCLEAALCQTEDNNNPCYGRVSERAWSTPIYVNRGE